MRSDEVRPGQTEGQEPRDHPPLAPDVLAAMSSFPPQLRRQGAECTQRISARCAHPAPLLPAIQPSASPIRASCAARPCEIPCPREHEPSASGPQQYGYGVSILPAPPLLFNSSGATTLQKLVTSQKSVVIDLDTLSRDIKVQSKELFTVGQSEVEDVKDGDLFSP